MAERERALEALGLNRLFGGTYAGRRVLVTGHTGFKGSWLALWLQALGAEVGGLALAPDTDPAHWDLLGLQLAHDARVDLRDATGVHAAVAAFQPDIVFHLAAQPLVRRGYREPVATFDTNVGGLLHLLEAVRSCASVRIVINTTTDKVYEPHATSTGYRENDPLGGHDPYSTSKACAELVSACYRRSFFDHDDGRGRLRGCHGFTDGVASLAPGMAVLGIGRAEDRDGAGRREAWQQFDQDLRAWRGDDAGMGRHAIGGTGGCDQRSLVIGAGQACPQA